MEGSNQGFTINPRKQGRAPQWLLDLPVFKKPEETLVLDETDAPVTFEDHYGKRSHTLYVEKLIDTHSVGH